MKVNDLYHAMGEISEEYVEAAREENQKSNRTKLSKPKYVRWLAAVACFVVIILGTALARKQGGGYEPLSVSASELAQKYYDFGITITDIVYADDKTAVMYDYRGLYVYDFRKEELVGYVDFEEHQLTQINGDGATTVEVSKDGKMARVYTMPSPDQEQRNYLYDIAKNKFTKVKSYSGKFERSRLKDVTDVTAPDALSVYGSTYELQDGSRIAYSIHFPEDDRPAVYGDLYLIREKDGKVKEFTIFQ